MALPGGTVSFSITDWRLAFTFKRRPLSVLSISDASGSPLKSSILLTFCTDRFDCLAHSSAAAPDTCGTAIDVPVKSVYEYAVGSWGEGKSGAQMSGPRIARLRFGVVLRTNTPGAARSTLVAPKCVVKPGSGALGKASV